MAFSPIRRRPEKVRSKRSGAVKRILRIFILCLFPLFLALIANANPAEQWIKVAGGKWNPHPQILSDIKAKIESYLLNQAKAQGRELKNWQEYISQYQGQEEDGK